MRDTAALDTQNSSWIQLVCHLDTEQPVEAHPFQPPDQPEGVAASAYRVLRDMLLSGGVRGGTVIQERRLADELGLSRTPVREALQRLEGEGLLERQDRFLQVVSVTISEVMEILAVRVLLECEAVRAACGQISPARICAVRERLSAMLDPDTVSDDEHWEIDDLLHVSIAEASGNRLLARLIVELRQKTRLFGLRGIPSRFQPGRAEHLAILDALERGDREDAVDRMHCHLRNARQAILATLSGQTE